MFFLLGFHLNSELLSKNIRIAAKYVVTIHMIHWHISGEARFSRAKISTFTIDWYYFKEVVI